MKSLLIRQPTSDAIKYPAFLTYSFQSRLQRNEDGTFLPRSIPEYSTYHRPHVNLSQNPYDLLFAVIVNIYTIYTVETHH